MHVSLINTFHQETATLLGHIILSSKLQRMKSAKQYGTVHSMGTFQTCCKHDPAVILPVEVYRTQGSLNHDSLWVTKAFHRHEQILLLDAPKRMSSHQQRAHGFCGSLLILDFAKACICWRKGKQYTVKWTHFQLRQMNLYYFFPTSKGLQLRKYTLLSVLKEILNNEAILLFLFSELGSFFFVWESFFGGNFCFLSLCMNLLFAFPISLVTLNCDFVCHLL